MSTVYRLLMICAVSIVWAGPLSAANSKTVEGYRARAEEALLDGRFQDAYENYEHIRTKLADDEALFISSTAGMLKSLFIQKKYQEALTVLNLANTVYLQTIKGNISPLGPDSQAILSYWRGRILLATNNVNGALPVLKSAQITNDRKLQAKAGLYYGRCFIIKKDYAKARTHFNGMVLDRDPVSERAQAGRAGMLETLLETEKWDEFDKLMDTASLLAKDHWVLEYTFLELRRLLKGGNAEGALEFYRNKLLDIKTELLPEYERIHLLDHAFYLAVRQIGLDLNAARLYRKARTFYVDLQPRLELDYQQQEILMDMASCAFNAMKAAKAADEKLEADTWFALAEDDLKRFIRKYPNSSMTAKVIYYQGQMLLEQDKKEDALAAFKNAFNHKQAPPLSRYEAAMQLAVSSREAAENDEALSWYTSAAEQKVDTSLRARAEFDRGLLLDNIGRTKDAIATFAGIVERYPKDQLIHKARFNHANSAYKDGKFKVAAEVLGKFLAAAPADSALRPTAMHLSGLALRESEDWAEAKTILFELAKKYPDHALAPRAILEAAEIATVTQDDDEFLALCNRVITEFPDSDLVADALYRRIHHYITIEQNIDKAEEDRVTYFTEAKGFTSKNPDAAVSILMWFGNYYFNAADYEKAEGFFAQAANDYPASTMIPDALYELAKSAYNRELKKKVSSYKDAIRHLKRLESLPKESIKNKTALMPKVYMLYGDILSLKSEYASARDYFVKCRNASKVGDETFLQLYFPAVGRIGDMDYSLVGVTRDPDEKKRLLSSAVENYTLIIDEQSTHSAMKEKALYHRGLVHSVMKNELAAEKDFREVFDGYFAKRLSDKNPLVPDNYFMVKAALKLIEYYLLSNQTQKAVTVYEKIQSLKDPFFSSWAKTGAAKLTEDVPKDFPANPPQ